MTPGSLVLHTVQPAHSSVLDSLFLSPVAGARVKGKKDLEISVVFSVQLISVEGGFNFSKKFFFFFFLVTA